MDIAREEEAKRSITKSITRQTPYRRALTGA
jgi:hypothetical protein